jgi:hypothetical protein
MPCVPFSLVTTCFKRETDDLGGTVFNGYVVPNLQFRSLCSCLALRGDVLVLSPLPRLWEFYHYRGMGEGQGGHVGQAGQDPRCEISICEFCSLPLSLLNWVLTI